ncbi:MAG: hypothetical protein KC478_05860 [Bacteriovoracaceae bacterium]|nr:hypothetical protein [Bacteriovoracaceae bacterium]
MKKILIATTLLMSMPGFSSEICGGERLATPSEFNKEHNPEIKNYEYAIEKLKASSSSLVIENVEGTEIITTEIKIEIEGHHPESGKGCKVTLEKEKEFHKNYKLFTDDSLFIGPDWVTVVFKEINLKLDYGATITAGEKSLGRLSNMNKYKSLKKNGVKIINSSVTPSWFSNRTISKITYPQKNQMLVEVEAIPQLGGGSEMYPALEAATEVCLIDLD